MYQESIARYPCSRRIIGSLAVVAALVWAWALWPGQTQLSVTFLDVRQGDSAFIRTPGGNTVLIDAGSGGEAGQWDNGSRTLTPFLRRQGIGKLDLLVMTHPHEDHIGGITGVLDSTRVDSVLDPAIEHPSAIYEKTLTLIEKRKIRYVRARRGQRIAFPDGVTIDVLNPAGSESGEDTGDSDLNNQSIVLRLSYKNTSFLFAADAEQNAEEEMLADCTELGSTVLKVGHHGAASSTSEAWLEAVKPQIAVISAGRNNQFGHPDRETLKRLADIGARVFRTDEDGAVTIVSDGERVSVSTVR